MTHHANAEARPGKQIPVDLTQPLVLTVHSHSGDIAIRAIDRQDVLITADWPGESEVPGDESGLRIDVEGNRIEVHPSAHLDERWTAVAGDIDLESVVGQIAKAFRGGGSFFSAKPGKTRIRSDGGHGIDIAVEVPQSMSGRFEVHCASGDAHVEGITGEITLNTMSGNVRAIRTNGALTSQSASGELLVDEASGRLSTRTASGDIRVSAARLDGFQMQTASGDVHLDATLAGDGPFRAQTASGDIRLILRRPGAAGDVPAATLAFQTVSGNARVNPPFHQTDRRRWRSGQQERGPHVDVTTVNGDLTATIGTSEDAFVATPSPADFPDEAPVAADRPRAEGRPSLADARQDSAMSTAQGEVTRLALLEAVERGEIDVEEALRRLETVDTGANP